MLARIADGLCIPREQMGLSYGADSGDGTYRGVVMVAGTAEEVSEDMKRAHFIAGLAAAALGQPVLKELLDPAPSAPGAVPLPSRLDMNHVKELRAWTEQLRLLARQYGGQADIVDAVANRSLQLMTVPGAGAVKRSLGSALAELHTVAGWACFDSGLHDHARHHFTQAAELAGHADDPYGVAYALHHAGGTIEEIGFPNDALKAFQLSQFRLADVHDDPRVPALTGWLHAESASAYAHLNHPDMARDGLTAARDGWDPHTTDELADLEWLTALIERDLGRQARQVATTRV